MPSSLQDRITNLRNFYRVHGFSVTYSSAGKRVHLWNNEGYDIEFLHNNYEEFEILNLKNPRKMTLQEFINFFEE
jgi:hypothetical protein